MSRERTTATPSLLVVPDPDDAGAVAGAVGETRAQQTGASNRRTRRRQQAIRCRQRVIRCRQRVIRCRKRVIRCRKRVIRRRQQAIRRRRQAIRRRRQRVSCGQQEARHRQQAVRRRAIRFSLMHMSRSRPVRRPVRQRDGDPSLMAKQLARSVATEVQPSLSISRKARPTTRRWWLIRRLRPDRHPWQRTQTRTLQQR